MTFELIYARRAERELMKLGRPVALRIITGCERLKVNPFPDYTHVKKLMGSKGLYRLRVGDYRMVFRLSKNFVEIIDVVSKPDFTKAY